MIPQVQRGRQTAGGRGKAVPLYMILFRDLRSRAHCAPGDSVTWPLATHHGPPGCEGMALPAILQEGGPVGPVRALLATASQALGSSRQLSLLCHPPLPTLSRLPCLFLAAGYMAASLCASCLSSSLLHNLVFFC